MTYVCSHILVGRMLSSFLLVFVTELDLMDHSHQPFLPELHNKTNKLINAPSQGPIHSILVTSKVTVTVAQSVNEGRRPFGIYVSINHVILCKHCTPPPKNRFQAHFNFENHHYCHGGGSIEKKFVFYLPATNSCHPCLLLVIFHPL